MVTGVHEHSQPQRSYQCVVDPLEGNRASNAGEIRMMELCLLLANRHLVKLGLIKKSERKRCPSFDRRHTARNPPTTQREACAREERQSGLRAYAAIVEIAVTVTERQTKRHARPSTKSIGVSRNGTPTQSISTNKTPALLASTMTQSKYYDILNIYIT
ncbi:hypothetical protein EVAR_67151_1 [Eumeta japonica]|uniref:Uncharacterized protein n=1 Tax=Eumeta variegata TaxID=151549 RepID=A0A4C1ZSE0_EUMVA|nr:hypothetical protein EVAR_67151_1 [Eumeta japonica]